MKYFVVADVHGFYDEMITALNDVGFDATNPNHTLISLGDAMDRGPKPVEVLQYFNSLPQKILIKGNHESLFEDLCQKQYWDDYDKTNGTVKTVKALADNWCETNKVQKVPYLSHMYFKMAAAYAKFNKYWKEYKEQLVYYFETEHYIFVHGWLPTINFQHNITHKWLYAYKQDWKDAAKNDWEDAIWTPGSACAAQNVFHPTKKIVCGHENAMYWHQYFEQKKELIHTPYFGEKVIAIDGCTVLSSKVNVLVIED